MIKYQTLNRDRLLMFGLQPDIIVHGCFQPAYRSGTTPRASPTVQIYEGGHGLQTDWAKQADVIHSHGV